MNLLNGQHIESLIDYSEAILQHWQTPQFLF